MSKVGTPVWHRWGKWLLLLLLAAVLLVWTWPRVGPAWYYRLKYYAPYRNNSDKVIAAQRTVQVNPFFADDFAVLYNLSKPSSICRLGLYDLTSRRCLVRTRALHGRGSGSQMAYYFSNKPGSGKTALGRYVIVDIYYGRFGRAYRLAGLDATNDNALARSVVLHSSAHVRSGHTGRSEGCPTVSDSALQAMRPYLRIGTLVWLYR